MNRAPGPVALVTVNDIARLYDFGASHPLRPERVLLTYEAIRDAGLLELTHVQELPARVAKDEEIRAVHDPSFVEAVRGIDEGAVERWAGMEFGLGTPDNPIFKSMHSASAAVCGASLAAAEAVVSGATRAVGRRRASASTTIRRSPSPRSYGFARTGG
jgi:acetoin utilization protein AcuC